MKTTFPIEPRDSPVPGVIPEPVRPQDTAPAATRTSSRSSSVEHRNPVSNLLAKVMSALRGDKYMVDAYPPEPSEAGRPE